MNTKLMLAGVVVLLLGGSAASQEAGAQSGATLKDHTNHLLETFGADITPITPLLAPWPGPACGTADRVRCEISGSLPVRYYCPNTQVSNHEVQEDNYHPFQGRISAVVDCQITSDRNRLCTTARNRYCP